MLLTYSIVYSLPLLAVESLFKLINSIFDTPVVPDTSYLINMMFNPIYKASFHLTCHECGSYLCQFDSGSEKPRIVTCESCEALIDTSELNGTNSFVIWNISEDVKKLIEANSDYYNSVMNRIPDKEKIRDIYDGKEYQKFVESLPEQDRRKYVTSVLNSDGSPIFKSSTLSIWPVQHILSEIPIEQRINNTIVQGLWFGKSKPNMQVFLKPIVENLNELSNTGIECNIAGETRRIKMFTVCCCVDSAARPPMQGLIQYNGAFGCSWCEHPGVYSKDDKCIKYTIADGNYDLRTKAKAKQDIAQVKETNQTIKGFKYETPLVDLIGFNIINGFVVDYMHNILLGIVRTYAKYWTSRGNEYSLSKRQIRLVDKVLIKLTPHTQIGRLSRPTKYIRYWKARECENWLLYYSGPILSQLLPNKYVEHWAKFVEAVHILLQKEISVQDLDIADFLLHEFVFDSENLYGIKSMTYNMHQLLHLAASVRDWGPLWAHNGYPFENGNGQLLQSIHAANGVISQVQRQIQFEKSLSHLQHLKNDRNTPLRVKMFMRHMRKKTVKNTFKTKYSRYIGRSFVPNKQSVQNCNMSLKTTEGYNKIIVDNCVHTTCLKQNKRSDNSYVMLQNKTINQIQEFLVDVSTKEEIIVGKIVQTKPAEHICKQTRQIEQIDDNVNFFHNSEIELPCNVINVNADTYICPVPNTCHL